MQLKAYLSFCSGSFRARLDSEKGDTGEFKSTENVYTEFFHDVKLKDEFTWDGIW